MDLVEASAYHRHALTRLNRSPQTLKLYAIYQNSFLAYLLSNDIELTLDALTPELVRRWQAWLRSQSTGPPAVGSSVKSKACRRSRSGRISSAITTCIRSIHWLG